MAVVTGNIVLEGTNTFFPKANRIDQYLHESEEFVFIVTDLQQIVEQEIPLEVVSLGLTSHRIETISGELLTL